MGQSTTRQRTNASRLTVNRRPIEKAMHDYFLAACPEPIEIDCSAFSEEGQSAGEVKWAGRAGGSIQFATDDGLAAATGWSVRIEGTNRPGERGTDNTGREIGGGTIDADWVEIDTISALGVTQVTERYARIRLKVLTPTPRLVAWVL
jgi:hypothetical protein